MCARQPTTPAPPIILPDYFHTRGMVKPGKHHQPRPGDWVCTRCTYYNYARHTRCHACRVASTATMARGEWLCPYCGNSQWSRRTKCTKCHIPHPVQGGEPGRPRRVVPGEPVADDAPELATTEQRVLPVPRRTTPRHCARCEEPGRPQKSPKIAHHLVPQDKIIPYPRSQANKVEQ